MGTTTTVDTSDERYQAFVADTTPLDLTGVCDELKVEYQTVKTAWRRDAIEGVRDQIDLIVIGQWLTERKMTVHPELLFPVVNRYLRRADDAARKLMSDRGMRVYDPAGKKPRSPRYLMEEFARPGLTAVVTRSILGPVAGPMMTKLARWGVDNLDRRVSLFKIEHGLAGDLSAGNMTQADVDRLKLAPHPHHLPMPDRIEWGRAIYLRGRLRRWAIQTGRIHAETLQVIRSKPPGRPADDNNDGWEALLAQMPEQEQEQTEAA